MENGRRVQKRREKYVFNREGTQMDPRRDPNAIDIDREGRGDKTCYVCGK